MYPVHLSLAETPCLVVGGGRVALRKVSSLLACDAKVTVVSPQICSALARLVSQGAVRWRSKRYCARYLVNQRLVIAATNDARINARISSDAQQQGSLVNVVDDPAYCTLYIPSVIRVDPLVVTVATEGRFPGLAKKIRQELTPELRRYAKQIRRLAKLRDAVKNSGMSSRQQRRCIRALLAPRVIALVEAGKIRSLAHVQHAASY